MASITLKKVDKSYDEKGFVVKNFDVVNQQFLE